MSNEYAKSFKSQGAQFNASPNARLLFDDVAKGYCSNCSVASTQKQPKEYLNEISNILFHLIIIIYDIYCNNDMSSRSLQNEQNGL